MSNETKNWNDLEQLETSLTDQKPDEHNLMLVDSNNLSYRWLKTKTYNSFEQDYIRTVDSLAKSYSAKKIICCYDFGKSYFRKELHPEYKSTRKKPDTPEEQKHYEEFFECLNGITTSLPYPAYKYRGVEADDTICFFVEKLKKSYDNIWIISSDRDIYQLIDTNVHIFNIFGRKEIDEDFLLLEYQLGPAEYLLSRYIEGDKSDAIEGVEGIGPVRSQNLAREYKTLNNLLNKLPIKGTSQYIKNLNMSKDLLLRNEKLINLKKYNEEAIKAGKDGEVVWQELERELLKYE